jgi:hypothetical protein
MVERERSPELRAFWPKITSSPALTEFNKLFNAFEYKAISDRCNDHVHVNLFKNLRSNSPDVSFELQMAALEQFAGDFRRLFIRHLGYVFSIRSEYMASSDYIDALECDLEPEQDSQYWVAPIVQEVFDEIITPLRPDVTAYIKENCEMHLA